MEIKLNNLSYAYHRKAKDALTDLNTFITPGIYLLLGENGAGKTTLLHIIAGLRFATSGECLIDGANAAFRLPSIMSKVAFLGDNMIFPADTINATAACHACFYPDFDPEILHSLLDRFGLTGNEKLRELSLGNRHKSQLAYIISLRPQIMLLDEPANGLDIESRNELQRILAEYIAPEQTVIISTHTFADLRNLYDGVMILSHGHLLLNSRVETILDRIVFGSAVTPPDNVLYFEPRLGRAFYMSPKQSGDETDTDIDYMLLYNAIKSSASTNIINYLNSQS